MLVGACDWPSHHQVWADLEDTYVHINWGPGPTFTKIENYGLSLLPKLENTVCRENVYGR